MKKIKQLLRSVYNKINTRLLTNGWSMAGLLFVVTGLFLSFLALWAFLAIADEVMDHDIKRFDAQITQWVHQFRNRQATRFMFFITEFGARQVYMFFTLLIAGVLLLLKERWVTIAEICLVLIMSGVLNRLLKYNFERPRPTEYQLILEESWSFPSGHAMSAIAFYGFIVLLIWRRRNYLPFRILLTLFLCLIILLVGVSRVYLGVHYPSDVLAGYAAGLFWLLLCGSIFHWVRSRQKQVNKPGNQPGKR